MFTTWYCIVIIQSHIEFKTFGYDILFHFFYFHDKNDKMYMQGIVFVPVIGKHPHIICYLIS